MAANVLLVEDDDAVNDATRMMLEACGYCVCGAADGDAALDHIRAGFRPDVIVADYRLPGANGVEVVHRVRRAAALTVPAIIITGDTSSREVYATRPDGVHVLRKPMQVESFIELVAECVRPPQPT